MTNDPALDFLSRFAKPLRASLPATDDHALAQHIALTFKRKMAYRQGVVHHRDANDRWVADKEGVSLNGATDAVLQANGGSNSKRRAVVVEKAKALLGGLSDRDREQDGGNDVPRSLRVQRAKGAK